MGLVRSVVLLSLTGHRSVGASSRRRSRLPRRLRGQRAAQLPFVLSPFGHAPRLRPGQPRPGLRRSLGQVGDPITSRRWVLRSALTNVLDLVEMTSVRWGLVCCFGIGVAAVGLRFGDGGPSVATDLSVVGSLESAIEKKVGMPQTCEMFWAFGQTRTSHEEGYLSSSALNAAEPANSAQRPSSAGARACSTRRRNHRVEHQGSSIRFQPAAASSLGMTAQRRTASGSCEGVEHPL